MKIYTTVLILIIGAVGISGCSTSAENAEVVDYATLEELPVKMVMEIGESESYLPGRIIGLEVMPDGIMFVADWGTVTIEQFNSDGEYVGTVARAGRGPGELNNNFLIYTLGNDTLISRDFSTKKNYYARSGGELFEHVYTKMRPKRIERFFTFVAPILKNKFYAISESMRPSPQIAAKNQRLYNQDALVLVDEEENILQDSIHVLKRSAQFVVQRNGGFTYTSVPYRSNDRFVSLQDGKYLIARPDSSAFFIYNRDHELDRRIPFRVKERPVTSEDLELALGGRSGKVRSEVENATPEVKPPYRGILASENYLWLLTDESEAGKEMVVVDFEGTPVGKFMLSEYDGIGHVEDGRIYAIHNDPDLGDMIRIYEVGIPAG